MMNTKNTLPTKKEKETRKKFNRNEKVAINIYSKSGINEAIKYIFDCKEINYLQNDKDEIKKNLERNQNLEKIKEFTLLPKGKKSIVKYLGILEDINTSKVQPYKNTKLSYKGTNEQKMSKRNIKEMKSKIKNINPKELKHLKSFIGIEELNRGCLQVKSLNSNLTKIKGLYTATLPKGTINLNQMIEEFKENEINITSQELIAFFSLGKQLKSNKNKYKFSRSVWSAIFGRKNIKLAKDILQYFGYIRLYSKAIPNFKSTYYTVNWERFIDELDLESKKEYEIKDIKTLVRINKITIYKTNFYPNEQLVIYKRIISLYLQVEVNKLGDNKLQTILLKNKYNTIHLTKDVTDLLIQLSYGEGINYEYALALGKHISYYYNYIKKYGFKKYRPFKDYRRIKENHNWLEAV